MLRVSRSQIYRVIFLLAGAYNIVVGLWAALAPRALFDVLDLNAPSHPGIWACLGMVIGLYGLIYLQVAFTDPNRRSSAVVIAGRRVEYDFTHVLIGIGLAGKILGPIGFVFSVQNGELPLRMISLIVLNDLIWWAPFAMYLIDGTPLAERLARHAPRLCSIVHVVAAGGYAHVDPRRQRGRTGSAGARRVRGLVHVHVARRLVHLDACSHLARRVPLLVGRAGRRSRRWRGRRSLSDSSGIFADFSADALFIAWLPEGYSTYAQFTAVVSQVARNGLYSIAGVILMFASAPMQPWFRAWGWTVWLAGFALAVSGAMRWDMAIVVSAGLLLATFIPWVWLANRFLDELGEPHHCCGRPRLLWISSCQNSSRRRVRAFDRHTSGRAVTWCSTSRIATPSARLFDRMAT